MKLLLKIKSLPTKAQILPYISQKNDRLANSTLLIARLKWQRLQQAERLKTSSKIQTRGKLG